MSRASCIRILQHGEQPQFDLTRPEIWAELLKLAGAAPAPDVPNVWQFGTPCTSFCDFQMQGLVPSKHRQAGSQASELLGNQFAEFSAEVCLTAWKAGREFGFESSAKSGRYPKIWDLPCMQRLRAATGARIVPMHMACNRRNASLVNITTRSLGGLSYFPEFVGAVPVPPVPRSRSNPPASRGDRPFSGRLFGAACSCGAAVHRGFVCGVGPCGPSAFEHWDWRSVAAGHQALQAMDVFVASSPGMGVSAYGRKRTDTGNGRRLSTSGRGCS